MNSLETTPIQPLKAYKVFLVEEGDDLRERVISAISNNIQIDRSPVFGDIDFFLDSVRIFKTTERVTLTIELNRQKDGSYYTFENFLEEDEDEE